MIDGKRLEKFTRENDGEQRESKREKFVDYLVNSWIPSPETLMEKADSERKRGEKMRQDANVLMESEALGYEREGDIITNRPTEK